LVDSPVSEVFDATDGVVETPSNSAIEELLQAVQEELRETEAILNAPPAAEDVQFVDPEPLLQNPSNITNEEDVAEQEEHDLTVLGMDDVVNFVDNSSNATQPTQKSKSTSTGSASDSQVDVSSVVGKSTRGKPFST
jgi:septum formation inhibitor MinC